MREFISHLSERGFSGRKVGFVENGTWALTAAKTMKGLLESCKNITLAEAEVHIKSAVNDENIAQIDALAEEMK
jgi:flavorubredoxin